MHEDVSATRGSHRGSRFKCVDCCGRILFTENARHRASLTPLTEGLRRAAGKVTCFAAASRRLLRVTSSGVVSARVSQFSETHKRVYTTRFPPKTFRDLKSDKATR